MDVQLPGHPYVKSPIDMACWDILGKVAGLPLWQLWGGVEAAPVAVNSSISTGTPEEMLALIEKAAARGYTVHSAKVGGTDIELDVDRIEAISSGLPKGHKVTFDVNRAWQPGVAVEVLNSVRARDWVEQPCETLDQCAHVAGRVSNPIMLDECMHTFGDHLEAWKRNACEGVKVKPNRVGGLTRARQIRDFGVSVGLADASGGSGRLGAGGYCGDPSGGLDTRRQSPGQLAVSLSPVGRPGPGSGRPQCERVRQATVGTRTGCGTGSRTAWAGKRDL